LAFCALAKVREKCGSHLSGGLDLVDGMVLAQCLCILIDTFIRLEMEIMQSLVVLIESAFKL
jgi:hypothetical protein